jgi:hypothetical protein
MSQVDCFSFSVSQLGLEAIFGWHPGYSFHARMITASQFGVLSVLGFVGSPEIVPGIISAISIPMINKVRWPFSSHVKPGQAVGEACGWGGQYPPWSYFSRFHHISTPARSRLPIK